MGFFKLRTWLFTMLLGLLLTQGNLYSSEPLAEPGEMIVKIKKDIYHPTLMNELLELGGRTVRPIKVSFGDFYVVAFSKEQKFSDLKALLEENPSIEYAEPNYIYKIVRPVRDTLLTSLKNLGSPSNMSLDDPLFSSLWGLNNTGSNDPKTRGGIAGADIEALKAWDIHRGDKNIKIAVIDTGIDYNHPDLKGQIWTNEAELNGKEGVDDDGNGFVDDIHGYDFANNDGDPMDGHGHGTHTSGTIGAVHNNQVGIAGVMATATIVGIKFLTDQGSGSTETAIKAIDYATKLGVDIMSNSWGGGGHSEALKEAIERASQEGIIFTAAAGNDAANNDATPHYPSNYKVPNVISVAATTSKDELAPFSSYGRETVHVAAPGQNINSTISNNKYAVWSGTSMATPHVTGALGLLLSKEGRFTHEQLKARLLETTDPVVSLRGRVVSGSGRLNAFNLLVDHRPVRNEPNENDWISLKVEPFESSHPYASRAKLSKTFKVPGAKFVRVVIKKFELEKKYDNLEIRDKNGHIAEKISDKGENYKSLYVDGDEVSVTFVSDGSVNKWGFILEEIQFIKN